MIVGNIIVDYVDKNGEKLVDLIVLIGKLNLSYWILVKKILGYKLY